MASDCFWTLTISRAFPLQCLDLSQLLQNWWTFAGLLFMPIPHYKLRDSKLFCCYPKKKVIYRATITVLPVQFPDSVIPQTIHGNISPVYNAFAESGSHPQLCFLLTYEMFTHQGLLFMISFKYFSPSACTQQGNSHIHWGAEQLGLE